MVTGLSPSRHRICVAYETLFALDARYHAEPPLFYHILSLPSTAGMHELATQLARKTAPNFEALENKDKSTTAYRRAEKEIKVLMAVGAVLMDPEVRATYDEEVVQGWKERKVRDVLMKDEMCGERWASREG
ncbi:hypothetical protein CDV36_014071 [Fusarium kuroshium]|uniref:J domain-containing protein n=1 Tax=Fusarium kuroshium TaxID=2010991 RepID=A0A3M2RIU3_9HYPO|nr:hypothetical protein CDV36_014071 [Fusarium kuroshium]